MNSGANDIIKETMLNKVKLFDKEKYFYYFSSVLKGYSHKLTPWEFRKKNSLTLSLFLDSDQKIKNSDNNKFLTPTWHTIMLLIFNYGSSKNPIIKENNSSLNPLCAAYIKYLCQKKIKVLNSFSINSKIPLKTCIEIYLQYCISKISYDKNELFQNKNSPFYRKKKNSRLSFSDALQNITISKAKKKLLNSPINNIKPINKNKQLDYYKSFTRLFIGETDKDSIRERYFSNMVIKKHKELHLYDSYSELSNMYLKKLYQKLFKNGGMKGAMDKDMTDVLKQLNNDHKKVENYQRDELILLEKKNTNHIDQYDEEHKNLAIALEEQMKKYKKIDNTPKKLKKCPKIVISKSNRSRSTVNIKKYNSNNGQVNNEPSNKLIEKKNLRSIFMQKGLKNHSSEMTNKYYLKLCKNRYNMRIGLGLNLDTLGKRKKSHLKNYLSNEDFFFPKL